MRLSTAQTNALMVFAYYAPNGHLSMHGKIDDLRRWRIGRNTLKSLCRRGLIALSGGPDGRFTGYALRDQDVPAMRAVLERGEFWPWT